MSMMPRHVLIALLLFIGGGAVAGSIALLTGDIDMSTDLLNDSPFHTYTVPAIILGVVVGGSALVAAGGIWYRSRWGREMSLAAGAILAGWLLVEFVWIPSAWSFQLFFFVIALLVLLIAWRFEGHPQPIP